MDLSNYETVKERKKRFYTDHEDGRIIVEIQNTDVLDYALFKVSIYKNQEEQEKGLAWSTGYALEMRDKEKSISKAGKEYETVNYTSWTENCEESAVGRALDNAGYSGNGKCSREEMEKAGRHSQGNYSQGNTEGKKSKLDFDTIKAELAQMPIAEMVEYWKTLESGGFASPKQQEAIRAIFKHAREEREKTTKFSDIPEVDINDIEY